MDSPFGRTEVKPTRTFRDTRVCNCALPIKTHTVRKQALVNADPLMQKYIKRCNAYRLCSARHQLQSKITDRHVWPDSKTLAGIRLVHSCYGANLFQPAPKGLPASTPFSLHKPQTLHCCFCLSSRTNFKKVVSLILSGTGSDVRDSEAWHPIHQRKQRFRLCTHGVQRTSGRGEDFLCEGIALIMCTV